MPLSFSSDTSNRNPDYKYPSVQYKDDLIEVKDDGNFRRHYLKWFDKEADFQAYYDLEKATEPSVQHKLRVGYVFPKKAVIRSLDTRAEDWYPLEATVDYDESKLEDFKSRTNPALDKYLVSASRAFLKTSFREVVVPDLLWEISGTEWSGSLGQFPTPEVLTYQLKKLGWTDEHINEINVWVLVQPDIQPKNKTADGTVITLQYPGTAQQFANVRFANGLLIRLPENSGSNVMIHELTHLFTANFKKTYGYQYCPFHGGGKMGYADVPGSQYPWIGANNPGNLYDFNMLRYYVTPRMWQKYGEPAPATPSIDASPSGYKYSEVYRDWSTLLPRLTVKDMETLLGVGLKVSQDDTYTLFRVIWSDRPSVESPHYLTYTTSSIPSNCIDRNVNNVAVIKIPSGHWLFVKAELMELFCDMPRQADYDIRAGQNWLPLYGFYSVDGVGMVLIKAPASLPVVESEMQYFIQNFGK